MTTEQYSTFINAPREKVWEVMFAKGTYEQWTSVFDPHSTVEGDWSEGSKILFVGGEGDERGGMVSYIEANRPYEFMSIKHVGIIKNGVEDTTSEEATSWAPAFENYTFTEKDGGTELLVEMDLEEQHREMFTQLWPKALARLKELAEA